MFLARQRKCDMWLGGVILGALVMTGCPEEPPQAGVGGDMQPPMSQPMGAPSDPNGQPPTGEQGAPQDAQAQGADAGKSSASEQSESKGLLLDEFFPDTLTQEQIKLAGDFITIKGMVLGDECKGKTIRIDALTPKELSNRLITAVKISDVGRYELMVPRGSEQVYVLASCDLDGDGRIQPDTDLGAAFPKNPIPASANADAVVLRFTKGKITEGMPPQPKVPPPPPGSAPQAPNAGGSGDAANTQGASGEKQAPPGGAAGAPAGGSQPAPAGQGGSSTR